MSHIENMEKILECVAEKTRTMLTDESSEIGIHEIYELADVIKDIQESIYKATIVKSMKDAEEEDEMLAKLGVDSEERRYYNSNRYASGKYAPSGYDNRTRRGYEEPMSYYMDPEMYRDAYYSSDSVKRRIPRMYYDGGSMGSSTTSNSNMNGGTTSNGRMYYDGSNITGAADRNQQRMESRYDRARRNYTENKEIHRGNGVEDKQAKMASLEEYAKSLTEDVTEMIQDASQEEKNLLRQKIQMLASKVQ